MPARDRSSQPEINLRLVWPQWQGGGPVSVQQLASEFPLDIGRRGWFTIAEFFPRQVMHLRHILRDFPLINDSANANDAAKS